MNPSSHFRPSLAQSAAVSASVLAAAALLGLVLAYWSWVWFAPVPEPRTPLAEPGEGGSATPSPVSFAAFGRAESRPAGATPAGPGSVRLLGVVAAAGSLPGYAVVRVDAKGTFAVRTGEEVVPGIRLSTVHVDRIVIERNGVHETLALPDRARAVVPFVTVPGK